MNKQYRSMRQVFSDLVGRVNLFSKLGLSYNDNRDLYKALGWEKVLNYHNFNELYRRNGIASACIDRPVSGCWKGLPVITENKGKSTPLSDAFANLAMELGLLDKFKRTDKMASLGRFAIILMGTNDITRPEEWSVPIPPGKKLKLLYVRPVSELGVTNIEKENNPSNPRYGLPKYYDISLGQDSVYGGSTDTSEIPLHVHHSRVVHIAFNKMDSEYLGTPTLEAIYNTVSDLDKVVGGASEMFWRGARPGFQGLVGPDFALNEESKAKMKPQLDEYENGLRRTITMQGMRLEALEQQIADPTSTFNIMLSTISAHTGIPKRILLGSEVGELASTSDRTAWLDYVSNRRMDLCDQGLARPFVNWCVSFGILPKPSNTLWEFLWPDIYAPSDEDKAKIGNQRTMSLKMYSESWGARGIIPEAVFLKELLGFSQESVESCLLWMQTELAKQREIDQLTIDGVGGGESNPNEGLIGDTGGNPEDSEGGMV